MTRDEYERRREAMFVALAADRGAGGGEGAALPASVAARLAEAVVLFHRGGAWMPDDRARWTLLTGQEQATTRALCDFARAVLAREAS